MTVGNEAKFIRHVRAAGDKTNKKKYECDLIQVKG